MCVIDVCVHIPGSQGKHFEEPASGAYVPAEHGIQEAAPAYENDPSGQDEHAELKGPEKYP